jgi:hypothetical protein
LLLRMVSLSRPLPRTGLIGFLRRSPDEAKIKTKMLYASSKDAIRRSLVGIAAEIQGTDHSEIAYTEGTSMRLNSPSSLADDGLTASVGEDLPRNVVDRVSKQDIGSECEGGQSVVDGIVRSAPNLSVLLTA